MDEVSLETSNKHSSPGSPGGPSTELALGERAANGQVMSGYTHCPPAPNHPVLEEEHSHWLLRRSSCPGPSHILPRLLPSSVTAGHGWKWLFCSISFVLQPSGCCRMQAKCAGSKHSSGANRSHLSARGDSGESGQHHGCCLSCSPALQCTATTAQDSLMPSVMGSRKPKQIPCDRAMLDTRPSIPAGHQP